MKKLILGFAILFAMSSPLVGMEYIDWTDQDLITNEEMAQIHYTELQQLEEVKEEEKWKELETKLSERLSTKPGSLNMSPILWVANNEERFFPPNTSPVCFGEEDTLFVCE
jgi:hypothetical protein